MTTRHSNLSGNISVVFHIFRGSGNFLSELSQTLICADKGGFKRVIVMLEISSLSSLVAAIKELPRTGNLKNLEISIPERHTESVCLEISKNLVCLHTPQFSF